MAGKNGQLWVIATPIGNLADLGERARRLLVEADVVLCEDTRGGRLWLGTHSGIASIPLPGSSAN